MRRSNKMFKELHLQQNTVEAASLFSGVFYGRFMGALLRVLITKPKVKLDLFL
jgi:hypothetical protein